MSVEPDPTNPTALEALHPLATSEVAITALASIASTLGSRWCSVSDPFSTCTWREPLAG